MPFDPTLAAIRFGSGLSPIIAAPNDATSVLAEVSEPFPFPIPVTQDVVPTMRDFNLAAGARRKAESDAEIAAAEAAFADVRRAATEVFDQSLRASCARFVGAKVGFAARLTDFWADHFTVVARNNPQKHIVSSYVEEAIAEHIGGTFDQMLRAVVTNPLMLLYLQQAQSMGPNSLLGKRRAQGINENLAREMLELHTIGVDAPYTQTDVRELAELLTGLTYRLDRGFVYDTRIAEPGAETVLGVTYDERNSLDNVLHAIDDLARHPQTAHHISLKLATYFMGQNPDPAMVADMAQVYSDTGGKLPAIYAAMLNHNAAWDRTLRQVKSPLRYVTSGLRALGVEGRQVYAFDRREMRTLLVAPMRVMGQPWQRPNGPDGWPDNGDDWINPQGMAGRINWAMTAPRFLFPRDVPDPRQFVETALGSFAGEDVRFAAGASESKLEGIGVVLASPAFQRS